MRARHPAQAPTKKLIPADTSRHVIVENFLFGVLDEAGRPPPVDCEPDEGPANLLRGMLRMLMVTFLV